MKKDVASLTIREVQIKNTLIANLSRMCYPQKDHNNKYWQGCGERTHPDTFSGGNIHWYSHCERSIEVSQKN